jgi:hypothetical protein
MKFMSKTLHGGTSSDVQAAVDAYSAVILSGTFNFGSSSVTIRNAVTISVEGEAIILGGNPPFIIDAPGNRVEIQAVSFSTPNEVAIKIRAVTGLRIAGCTIRGVLPVPMTIKDPKTMKNVTFPSAGGIVGVSQDPPGTGPVKDIAGDLLIVGNTIDIGVNDPASRTFGIQMNLKGQSTTANVTMSGNTVRNVTAHGMVLRDIPGQAVVQNNPTITTGAVGGRPGLSDQFVDGIMCQGSGKYQVRGNTIDCGYENSAGIRLQSISPSAPITATVVSNKITMSIPSGAVAGDESAGVELRRNCLGNSVSNNTILGSARAGLSLIAENFSNAQNELRDNNIQSFCAAPSLTDADIFVGEGVNHTLIVGQETPNKSTTIFRPTTIFDAGTDTQMGGNFSVVG